MIIKYSSISSNFLWILRGLIFTVSLYIIWTSRSILIEWELLILKSNPIWFYLLLDPKGLLLSAVVLFISANVLQFASFYIREEPFLKRFIILVLLFVLSINLLIFLPHFMILLLGWDGLGITSFALVIYYQSSTSLGAGLITALTNRIGDVLILISIALCLHQSHWNILLITLNNYSYLIVIIIILAAITKSAQIPFSRWLPAAIAAPTPVSALVHSSTLVTAGVFLLIRFYPFLSQFHFFNIFLLLIASLTIVIAGLAAQGEADLKKIIALSTLSQLGIIIAAIALNSPHFALFHLMSHALFKALLFLTAGSLIAINNHSQDLRKVGNLFTQIPCLSSCIIVSNIALCAFPFIAGFYSKDIILEIGFFSPINFIIIILFFLGTILTTRYSIRFIILCWLAPNQFSSPSSLKDYDLNSLLPSLTLRLGAIGGGSCFNWLLVLPSIDPILHSSLKHMPLFLIIIGGLIIYFLIINNFAISLAHKFLLNFFVSIWFFTPISSQRLLKPFLSTRLFLNKSLDQGWNEYLGPKGLFFSITALSNLIISSQKTLITSHLILSFFLILPIIIFICWNSLSSKA